MEGYASGRAAGSSFGGLIIRGRVNAVYDG